LQQQTLLRKGCSSKITENDEFRDRHLLYGKSPMFLVTNPSRFLKIGGKSESLVQIGMVRARGAHVSWPFPHVHMSRGKGWLHVRKLHADPTGFVWSVHPFVTERCYSYTEGKIVCSGKSNLK
jgi:hypothetical protein